jgi:putative transcription factor
MYGNTPCEMCGKNGELFKANIEGAELMVCRECARFGKIISRAKPVLSFKQKEAEKKKAEKPMETVKKEIIQLIVDDYSTRIKNARERLGLKQEELAKKLAERESLIQSIESGKFVPGINLARKFERYLNVKLIEQHEEAHDSKYKSGSMGLTIGDMINIKK